MPLEWDSEEREEESRDIHGSTPTGTHGCRELKAGCRSGRQRTYLHDWKTTYTRNICKLGLSK